MKAALLTDIETLSVAEVAKPVPAAGELLIRVKLAGICGSDSSLFRGKCNVPFPVIPGHECVGVVEEINAPGSRFVVGQRVVIQPNLACGTCTMCLKGLKNVCRSKVRLGIDRNGVFAEYVTVPQSYVWNIPDGLPDEVAVFAEPLAVARHGLDFAVPKKNDRVLVFGAGVIGQLVLQLALLTTRNIVACDLSDSRLELATQSGARSVKGCERLSDDCQAGFEIVFETSGSPAALSQAIDLVAPGGTIVLFGLPAAGHEIRSDVIVRKEIRILGSIIYVDEFPTVIELLANGRIATAPLISDTIDLEGLAENLHNFYQPNRIKTLVRIENR
ncbi:zinc-dependent alcohol dehydrogenase [Desulforhopalus singaporensis]|uniref:L-iditol 2-dehydrogenase n=1 Tax=Desulforhopalus singaporensis TaxID=91360 RepID=A0A1H0KME3_9BACT|nr:alcohol dehydrogenase catalytic domain-containing protein [Desulforhopalus singaporensis]SDO57164.1 L-iditol 2-dehydrogenase [Desulforhopalus singaporensis]